MLALASPQIAVDWKAVLGLLPQPALRRSWFVKQFPENEGYNLDYFIHLLAEVAPQKVRALAGQGGLEHYVELLYHCASLFPVNLDWALMDADEGTIPGFIPVDSLGFDPWDRGIDSPAVAVCIVAYHAPKDPYGPRDGEREIFEPGDFDCLARFMARLPDLSARAINKAPLAPSGRRFKRPWDGLADLHVYANSQTGYGFLDISDIEESGYSYPEWNADEINSLAAQWRDAKPIFERAMALRKYVDDRPRERLPILANALLGDLATLKQITAPKAKRLAEVWK